MRDRSGVDHRIYKSRGENSLDLGGENELAAPPERIVERLLAESVARGEQRASALVPYREGEHAWKLIEAPGSVPVVKCEDQLRIGARPERIIAECPAQRLIAVDLSIEHDSRLPVRRVHRLVTCR